ncbi:hypothetical protein HWV62_33499 [Athelia sp. TMB]|nr:hypothetical protein HWV62_2990 [Athelia sp. TMB]KAF7981466.1 hypothetical protein HWV62_33499 [Athelia sp. TMB]
MVDEVRIPALVYQIVETEPQLSTATHHLAAFRGYQYEDATKLVWVNVWKHHHKDSTPEDEIPSNAEHKPEIYHVKIPSNLDVTKSIAAPCTEIAHWTVPQGESVDTLLELIEQLHAAFLRGEGLQGMHQAPTHENPNLVVNFLGWDSLEAHQKAVLPDTEAYAVIQKMLAFAQVTGYHVSFKRVLHEQIQ